MHPQKRGNKSKTTQNPQPNSNDSENPTLKPGKKKKLSAPFIPLPCKTSAVAVVAVHICVGMCLPNRTTPAYQYMRSQKTLTPGVMHASQLSPARSNPIQRNPIRSNPIQSDPIQSNPTAVQPNPARPSPRLPPSSAVAARRLLTFGRGMYVCTYAANPLAERRAGANHVERTWHTYHASNAKRVPACRRRPRRSRTSCMRTPMMIVCSGIILSVRPSEMCWCWGCWWYVGSGSAVVRTWCVDSIVSVLSGSSSMVFI